MPWIKSFDRGRHRPYIVKMAVESSLSLIHKHIINMIIVSQMA